LQLFAEGKTRRELSSLNLQESLGSFFRLLQPDSFLGVLVFLPQTPGVVTAFQAIRRELTEKLNAPVLMVNGPRALYHYSHLRREGRPKVSTWCVPPILPPTFLFPEPLTPLDSCIAR